MEFSAITVNLERNQVAMLQEESKRLGVPVSQLVRAAIASYVQSTDAFSAVPTITNGKSDTITSRA